ncbi:MAG TPA: DUF6748 domain-containing protein [Gaiellaceae bacterium]|nr:DUF6748 domain-containing protein [Gaiellaceae bacterium]
MISRSAVSLVVLVVALGTGSSATGGPPPVGASVYVVRPDPRLCPSPLCGGYWVARANHARTRCHDELLRPRCYVASAIDVDGLPLAADVPDGSLARADIRAGSHPGLGTLGVLIVADVRAPAGEGTKGRYYRVRDLGIRCVRAPCFSLRAARLNRSLRTLVSSLDLISTVRPSAKQLAQAEAALATPSGLWLLGRITATNDGGRMLVASRYYLGSTS